MWNDIRKEWETTDISFVDLAEKHGLKASTIRSRKNREKWQRNEKATQRKNIATKKSDATRREKAIAESVHKNDNLTDKQKLFCIYYIKYFNATKAYQKAYDCAYTTAMSNGHRLLGNAEVNAEIDRLKEEQAQEIKLDVQDILQKYIDIAFADISDFVDFGQYDVPLRNEDGNEVIGEDGEPVMAKRNYVSFKDSAEVDGTIMSEVRQGKDGVSIKLADKMKALEMLAKFYDLLSERDKGRYQIEKLKAETEKLTRESKKEEPPQINIIPLERKNEQG